MLNRIKAKCTVLALVAIVLTFVNQGTYAYFSAVGKATNVVTTGNITFEIQETSAQGTEFPNGGFYVLPGDVISKEVKIKSLCDHPFYLRVKIVSGIDNKELSAEDCIALNIDPTVWSFHDGWYYLNDIVEPGASTPNVFSRVEIVGSVVDNSYSGSALDLTVLAHAVQSENNPLSDGLVHTASGWPAE